MKVAVVGLGSMGFGIGRSLLRAGHEVYGQDIDDDAVSRFIDCGGLGAVSDDGVGELDAVVTVVVNADQTDHVLFGGVDDASGLVPRLAPGVVVVGCATVAPNAARDFEARCNAHGVLYLDAPVSGGSIRADTGELSVMASGSQAAFLAAAPILDAIGASVFDLGDSAGAGSAMKAVNQLLCGVHIATMAEALTFGLTQGVDPATFVDVISQSAGTSWMLENRAPHIVAGDYTPHSQIDIWPKDLGIVLASAAEAGFVAPITEAALAQFQAASDMGLGGQDDAAVAKVYGKRNDVDLPARQDR